MAKEKTNLYAKTDRKTKIIIAGLKVFCKKSYESATIDDITKKARCSHGLFYHYFSSKKELFAEIISLRKNNFDEDIKAKINSIEDYRDKLRAILEKIFSDLKKDDTFAYFYFFFITQCFSNRDKPKIIDDKKASPIPPHKFFEQFFLEGQSKNHFSTKHSPRECARLMISIIQGLTLGYVIAPREVRLKINFPSIDFIIDIFNEENSNGND